MAEETDAHSMEVEDQSIISAPQWYHQRMWTKVTLYEGRDGSRFFQTRSKPVDRPVKVSPHSSPVLQRAGGDHA